MDRDMFCVRDCYGLTSDTQAVVSLLIPVFLGLSSQNANELVPDVVKDNRVNVSLLVLFGQEHEAFSHIANS